MIIDPMNLYIDTKSTLVPVYPEGTNILYTSIENARTLLKNGWEIDDYQQCDCKTHMRIVKYDNN